MRRASEPAVPAAALVLMRDTPSLEVLLLRRNQDARFGAGAYVFPGGRVDAADGEQVLADRWDGLSRKSAARRLGLSPETEPPALAYYGAAVREAFEETGLLACAGSLGAPRDQASCGLRRLREALLKGSTTLAEVLRHLDARLDGTALEYVAHWVTPAAVPRRYDTRFFATRVPPDARVAHDAREMTDSLWLSPARALDRHRNDGLPLMVPTIRTLECFQQFDSSRSLLAFFRGRKIPRVQPEKPGALTFR